MTTSSYALKVVDHDIWIGERFGQYVFKQHEARRFDFMSLALGYAIAQEMDLDRFDVDQIAEAAYPETDVRDVWPFDRAVL